MCATGIAKGGILRGLNKTNVPVRVPRMSIGVLRHIPYQPEAVSEFPELKGPMSVGKPRKRDMLDGQFDIDNSIDWVIKAVS
jgi:hypothetical protein